jgi:hypothetical protein
VLDFDVMQSRVADFPGCHAASRQMLTVTQNLRVDRRHDRFPNGGQKARRLSGTFRDKLKTEITRLKRSLV